jgi:tetraacyldisaccharide 4'-kinase
MASGDWSIHGLLSGELRGPAPSLVRGLLRLAEPLYATVMRLRNHCYDHAIFRAHQLPAGVVSVGNITAGGTGKTPVVKWLAAALAARGHRPGILTRGYKGKDGASDEQTLLAEALPDVPIRAQPDRVTGGHALLAQHADLDILLLDDGFQHRRLRRDFDLVLIDATNPFGFGHVHPRGLLREPLAGLRRADAFILTRSDLVPQGRRDELAVTLRAIQPAAPVYRARHAITGLRSPTAGQAVQHLRDKRFFAVAGIANPASLQKQLPSLSGAAVGHRWFPDHHAYSADDVATIRRDAAAAHADVIVVTEKDWVKLRRHPDVLTSTIPFLRLDLSIEFDTNANGLIELIEARLEKARRPIPADDPD